MYDYVINPVFMKIFLLGSIIILLYFILKYFCFSRNENNPFANNLMKYISSGDEKYKENLPRNEKFNSSNKKKKNQSDKKGLDLTDEHSPLTNQINFDFMGDEDYSNKINMNNKKENYFCNLSKAEVAEKEAKILRFAIDYCRASPNIILKQKQNLNIGWRNIKFHFDVDLEMTNKINYKVENENCIMTAVPINKALINFDDLMLKESFISLYLSFNHKNLFKNLHFDILRNQNLLIKIQKFYENGSIKDLLFKSNPKKNFSQKYPNSTKGKPFHSSLISLYGRQILDVLNYLHSNRWYHLHLHTGNILVDEKTNTVKVSELENFVCDLPLKNEQYFNFIFEDFNQEYNQLQSKNSNQNSNTLFSDIFKNQYNVFEKIDLISFGRIIYEMTTGKELKSPYPDELEYKDMDIDIANILRLIFVKKSKFSNNGLKMPEISVGELLKINFFNNENTKNSDKNAIGENKDELANDSISKLNIELDNNELNKSGYENNDQYCGFIKEKIFNQTNFLSQKNRQLNKFI